jgi:hypothetical protein
MAKKGTFITFVDMGGLSAALPSFKRDECTFFGHFCMNFSE